MQLQINNRKLHLQLHFSGHNELTGILTEYMLMAKCKKDVTPLLTHWSYVFLALTHHVMADMLAFLYVFLFDTRGPFY